MTPLKIRLLALLVVLAGFAVVALVTAIAQ
ncbi:hypothetical protein FHU39_003990 [Flexivirga oryzae]|uniref:Uncharacterized protein n=1 Tax=Flexivirga oryzae TaxID=1794944 RepID=A0A839NDB5_9MICO|nr:hypothetical protein [Flexivirga oryzae]